MKNPEKLSVTARHAATKGSDISTLQYDRARYTGCSGWRRSGGSVSGSMRWHSSQHAAVNSTRKTNTDLQPNHTCSHPPITGATAGAIANEIVTCDITRWASAP